MKSILITASLVGIAAAGVILYLRNRNTTLTKAGRVVDAAVDAHKTMTDHMNRAETRGQHAMG